MKARADMPFTIGKRSHCSLRSVEDRDALVHQFRYVPPFVVKRLCRDDNFHNLGWDDALSEGFLALVRAAELWRGDGEASFKTYACLAVRRRVIQALRTASLIPTPRTMWERHAGTFVAHVWIYAPEGDDCLPGYDRLVVDPDPGDEEELVLRKGALWEMVDSLPPRERDVVRLSVLSGIDNAHIGKTLGISKEGVRQVFIRAVIRLQAKVTGVGDE